MAACGKQNAIVKLLLCQPGLDVNVRDNYGYTALHFACATNNVEVLKILLAHPSMNSHNAENYAGKTPSMLLSSTLLSGISANRYRYACTEVLFENEKVKN